MSRRIKTILAALLLGAALPVTAAAAESYSDVKAGDWYYNAVTVMSEAGIISGNPNGTFLPENTVTYGDFITMAVKAATGRELPAAEAPAHWAKHYYDLAVEQKIITEQDISANALNMPIPRAYMALICSNILGGSVDVSGEYYSLLEKSVSDVEAGTPCGYEIIRSYGAGILSGYTDGTFKPDATLQRCEAASVIWHLADEKQRNIPSADELKKKIAEAEGQTGDQQSGGKDFSQKYPIEERIADILKNGVKPVTFDPAADEMKDQNGRTVMKEEKASRYMDAALSTVKFHGSGGKYYLSLTIPELPEGYEMYVAADVICKPELGRPQWILRSNSADPKIGIPRAGTVTREITGVNSPEEVFTAGIMLAVVKTDDTFTGSYDTFYNMQWNSDNSTHFSVNRGETEGEKCVLCPYNVSRHFIWK